MSRITTQASHPRRAVADAPRTDTFGSARDSLLTLRDRFQQPEAETARYAEIAAAAEADDNRHTLNSSLAALTVSALGLAVAGAVTMTSNAQAANPQAVLEAQQQSIASATVAEPAPARPASPAGPAATGTTVANTTEQTAETGALEGRTSDNTSRTAARTELDAAMGAQLATERSKQLSAASDSAAEASREAALASRSDRLSNSTGSISAENDRLAKAKQATAAAAKAAPAAPLGTLNITAAKSATQSNASTGGAASPMKRGTFSLGARFGAVGSWSRYHTGADLPAPVGTPIFAAASGVIASPNGGGWAGNHVVIQHSDGGATLYAHMSSTSVGVGQTVSAGQLIGYVGMTGRTFGPHLHWEYYPSASTVGNPYTTANPVAWLAARGVSL